MKTKLKKYLKEVMLFLVLLSLFSAIVSFYRTSDMEIDDDVCADGEQIVYFWATWCPVCKMTSPNIERVAEKFDVSSIAVRSGDEKRIGRYMSQEGLHFHVTVDPEGKIAKKNGVDLFPVVVFCRDGHVKAVEAGYMSTFGLWLRAWFFSL